MNPEELKNRYWEGVEARFWAKVDKTETCWTWRGSQDRHGYGHARVVGENVLVHRFAYAISRGPIPEGMTVDHLCFNTICVNPDHLRLLTHSENAANQQSTVDPPAYCPRGHEYTEENTYWNRHASSPNRRPTRYCRTCNREAQRRSWERKKAAAR